MGNIAKRTKKSKKESAKRCCKLLPAVAKNNIAECFTCQTKKKRKKKTSLILEIKSTGRKTFNTINQNAFLDTLIILHFHKRSFILKQKLARDTTNFEDRHGKLGTKKAQVICYQKNHILLCSVTALDKFENSTVKG